MKIKPRRAGKMFATLVQRATVESFLFTLLCFSLVVENIVCCFFGNVFRSGTKKKQLGFFEWNK